MLFIDTGKMLSLLVTFPYFIRQPANPETSSKEGVKKVKNWYLL